MKGNVSLAMDIIVPDRIIVRPYRGELDLLSVCICICICREVDQFQAILVKCLECQIADRDQDVVEGNQFGKLVIVKHQLDVYLKDDPELEGMTSKIVQISKFARISCPIYLELVFW